MSAPEWLRPGAAVVEFTPSQYGSGAGIEETVVDRLLKRDVVLANGHRFNVDRLRKSNGTWAPQTELLPVDDPQIDAARWENRKQALARRADTAYKKFRRSRSAEEARKAIEAIGQFVSHVEAVRA